MNLTYQYLHFFSFNNCKFYSLAFILHPSKILFIYFYSITFLMERLLWRDKHQNTGHAIKGKKECIMTKIRFVSRVGWPQWERQFNFFKLSVLQSIRYTITVSNQSRVCTSRKYMCLKLFAWYLTSGKCLFPWTNRWLRLIRSPVAQEEINYLPNTKEVLMSVAWENILSDNGVATA